MAFFTCEDCGEYDRCRWPGQRLCMRCRPSEQRSINSFPKPLTRKIACGDRLYRARLANFGAPQIEVQEYEVQSVKVWFRVAPPPTAPPLASGRVERLRLDDLAEFSTTVEGAVGRLLETARGEVQRLERLLERQRDEADRIEALTNSQSISTIPYSIILDEF